MAYPIGTYCVYIGAYSTRIQGPTKKTKSLVPHLGIFPQRACNLPNYLTYLLCRPRPAGLGPLRSKFARSYVEARSISPLTMRGFLASLVCITPTGSA